METYTCQSSSKRSLFNHTAAHIVHHAILEVLEEYKQFIYIKAIEYKHTAKGRITINFESL
jgi:hypothetical protein